MSELLGAVENQVMSAVAQLPRERAYGVAIFELIKERTGRELVMGTIYQALRRLERKGFLESEFGESRPERGGRPRRYYWLTEVGRGSLVETVRTQRSLWEGLDLASLAPA